MSQLELFEERAAIMEHDGGLSRWAAEQEAAKDVARVFALSKAQRDLFEGLGWGAGKALRFNSRDSFGRSK